MKDPSEALLIMAAAVIVASGSSRGGDIFVRNPMDDPPNRRILESVRTTPEGEKSLRLLGTHIRDRDVDLLRGLRLTELELVNTSVTDFTFLTNMPLRVLNLGENAGLNDLSCLSGLPVEHLTLWYCPGVTNLAPLAKLPLHTLELRGCTHLADLRPIQGLKLKRLSIGQTAVADLAPLTNMSLMFLEMRDCIVTDVSPLLQPPIAELFFSPEQITVGLDDLRKKNSVLLINHVNASVFWSAWDKRKTREAEPEN